MSTKISLNRTVPFNDPSIPFQLLTRGPGWNCFIPYWNQGEYANVSLKILNIQISFLWEFSLTFSFFEGKDKRSVRLIFSIMIRVRFRDSDDNATKLHIVFASVWSVLRETIFRILYSVEELESYVTFVVTREIRVFISRMSRPLFSRQFEPRGKQYFVIARCISRAMHRKCWNTIFLEKKIRKIRFTLTSKLFLSNFASILELWSSKKLSNISQN